MRFVSGLKRSDLQHKVSIFHGGRTVDGVVGEVVVGVQHPQLFRLEHVLVPGLKHGQLLFSSRFVQNPVLSNVFHLSVIWIMKDIVEDFRLDITEHRLQPNHSKEIIFKSRSSIFFNNSIIHTSLYDNVYLIISSRIIVLLPNEVFRILND